MAATVEELSVRLRCKTGGGESEIQLVGDQARKGSYLEDFGQVSEGIDPIPVIPRASQRIQQLVVVQFALFESDPFDGFFDRMDKDDVRLNELSA